ncbi:metallophosphoesterase [Lysinibacillus sp. NPDC096418]|uniref:metallophosphoesterase n=1 Tax=Lysinibacillus sp. NPDC096418 TaxID=3364138 RepID=UPI003805269B
MENVFVIGDIHGKIEMFEELIKKWNPDNQQLVLLGDLIDRGEDSYAVVKLAQELRKKYGAIVLSGNHEKMFLEWLEQPVDSSEKPLDSDEVPIKFYVNHHPHGGQDTLRSFFKEDVVSKYRPLEIAEMAQKKFKDELAFIRNFPLYYEWQDYIFVHAGVNLSLANWKNTNESDFYWIRGPFHNATNETGKTIVFGHTTTDKLNKDGSDKVWISPCGTKIGIDGGAVFGGSLHALSIQGNQETIYSVNNDLCVVENVLNRKASD